MGSRSTRTARPGALAIVFAALLGTGAGYAQEPAVAPGVGEPAQVGEAAPEAPATVVNPLVIADIQVRGSENVDSQIRDLMLAKSYFLTRVGDEISQESLSNDIRRIYADFGPFADVSVDAAPTESGLVVTFVLQELPTVRGDVELVGTKHVSAGKLRKLLTLKDGSRFSEYALWQAMSKALDEYRKEGYYFAKVDPTVDPVEDDRAVRVRLTFTEGERVKVARVEFKGNSILSDKALRDVVKTRRGKRFNDEDFSGDTGAILDAYHEHGALNARVVSAENGYDEDLKGLRVAFQIDEGAQFVFEGYEVAIAESAPAISEQKVRAELRMEPGVIFNKTTYIEDVERVRDLYANRGNILADIVPDVLQDSEAETVRIRLRISEGSTITINQVRIDGLTKTKEYVIRRELARMDLEPGKPLKASNLQKAHQNIIQLGSFIRGLEFVPVSTDDPKAKDLVVQIAENVRTGLFTIGGGYGSESGIFGVAEVGEGNLFGRAYRLNVKGELGARERRVGQIGFGTPWILGTPTSANLQLYSINRRRYLYSYDDYRNSAENSYDDYRQGASLSLSTPISRDITAQATLRDETVRASYLPLSTLEDEEQFVIGARETRSIGVGLSRDTRRYRTSLFDPNGGGEDTVFFEHSGGALGGRNAFRKYTVESSRFFDTWRKLVLALHFRAGHLQDRSGIHPQYLFYERYWLGGIDSVRGYPDFSLLPGRIGSTTINGTNVEVRPGIGGNSMFYANAEYRWRINDRIRTLAFVDAGQVWNEGSGNVLRDLSPHIGVGVGVHLELAAGFLIRLEYGIPLTSVPYYDPETKRVLRRDFQPRLHFSMGPSF